MKAELFDELTQSIREGGAILRGEQAASRALQTDEPAPSTSQNPVSEVERIRTMHELSQSEFAKLLGVTAGTVRRWERGARVPRGPVRVLLNIVEKHPQALRAASGAALRPPRTRRTVSTPSKELGLQVIGEPEGAKSMRR